MDKAMTRIELLARRFADPKVMFHGTSSKFLRSIMVNGLDPDLAKEGVWVNTQYKNSTFHSPSARTLGGIYFAGNLLTAIGAGRETARKLGGNNLLICASIQDRSALPDEDSYASVSQCFYKAVKGSTVRDATNAWFIIKLKLNLYNQSYTDYFTTFTDEIIKAFKIDIDKRKDAHIVRQTINSLFIACLTRKVAHVLGREGDKPQFKKSIYEVVPENFINKIQKKNFDGTTYLDIPRRWYPTKMPRAEALYRKVLDQFIKLTKGFLQMDDNNFQKTLRLLTPIKFRGRNRITCILEFLPAKSIPGKIGSTRKDYIRLHYGRVPPEFFLEWKARMGDIDSIEFVKEMVMASTTLAFQGDLGTGPSVGGRPYGWVPDQMMLDEPVLSPPKGNGKDGKDDKAEKGGGKNKKPPFGKKPPADDSEDADEGGDKETEDKPASNKGKSGKKLLNDDVRNKLKKPAKKSDDNDENESDKSDETDESDENDNDSEAQQDDEGAKSKAPSKKSKAKSSKSGKSGSSSKGSKQSRNEEDEAGIDEDEEPIDEAEDDDGSDSKVKGGRSLLTPELRKLLRVRG